MTLLTTDCNEGHWGDTALFGWRGDDIHDGGG